MAASRVPGCREERPRLRRSDRKGRDTSDIRQTWSTKPLFLVVLRTSATISTDPGVRISKLWQGSGLT
jgi:hypothetical protein